MEFDELKKIWDAPNNQHLYVLDEQALHKRIESRMNTVRRLTNITDWVLILVNLGAGGILIGLNTVNTVANLFMYVEAAWMFVTVVYFTIGHIRRVKAGRRFDRSLHGDLDHAIFLANYRIRLDQVILWNLLPMGAIMILSGWEAGKLLKVSAVILASYALAFYVTSKGHRANKRRKRELQALKEKLEAGN